MTDDELFKMNRQFVAEQKARREASRGNVLAKLCSSLFLTAAERLTLDRADLLETRLLAMEDEIRQEVEAKNGMGLTMCRIKKLNGDMEVRGMFTQYMPRVQAVAEMAANEISESLH